MSYKFIIGSHVSMSGSKNYLKGAIEEAIDYDANALMIYTGAPQNTKRVDTSKMFIQQGKELFENHNFEKDALVIHAPYIVNLANADKTKRNFAINFLKAEYKRCYELGAKFMVLHPGNHLKEDPKQAMDWIIEGLNKIIESKLGVIIALETMAGKGTEVGKTFEEIKYMMDGVKNQNLIGVCFDTCHVYDAGYDLVNNLEGVINEFDQIIGLDKNLVMHINDSKNKCGSAKDRHENIGFGHIGFNTLNKVVWHPKFDGIVKILETPWVDKRPPYKEEILNFKNKKFQNKVKEKCDIREI